MVQIIQSGPSASTIRQQALDKAYSGIVQGIGAYQQQEQQKALTQRQQALEDQKQKASSVEALVKGGYDVNPTNLALIQGKDVAAPVISQAQPAVQAQDAIPAQAAVPGVADSYKQPVQSLADLGQQDQGRLNQILSTQKEAVPGQDAVAYQPARPEVLGPKPTLTFNAYKQQELEAKKTKAALDAKIGESTIVKNLGAGKASEANANYTTNFKPQQIDINQQKADDAASKASNGVGAKQITQLNRDLGSFRGHPAQQQAETALYSVEKVMPLLNKPTWSEGDRNLAVEEVLKMAKGGVAGEGGIHAVLPATAQSDWNKLLTMATGNPSQFNEKEFQTNLKNYVNEIGKVSSDLLDRKYASDFMSNAFGDLSAKDQARYLNNPKYAGALKLMNSNQQAPQAPIAPKQAGGSHPDPVKNARMQELLMKQGNR